jgi:2-amino-4-hydroxy-6-hydroxymethyldihydropteridine diphosphokinase
MKQTVLLLGSNLDNRLELLASARCLIIEQIGHAVAASSIYESDPWGYDSNNPFLNQALLIKTNFSPEKVLGICLSIEAQLGRTRNENGAYTDRNIDIDILLYEELIISNETLEIPHPRMHQRRFCMEPLSEIAPNWLVPTFQKTTSQVLAICSDLSKISILNA